MEWETYFQKRILDRGYDYYFDDRVEDLRINSNRIKAVVNGTDFYHVEIKLNGNKIIGMSCDCPYAEDGHNCKHMAAVLYEWQLSATHPVIDNSKLVKEASEEDVRSFLIQVLNDQPSLVETFKQYTQNEFSLTTMIDDLEGVVDSYSDGYHYIDYEFSCDFCDNYEDAIFKWLDLLKEKKQYSLAFKFLLKAYDIFDKLDIEDNEGETYDVSFSIINACSNIIMCMEKSERIDAFNLLKQFLNNIRYSYDRIGILQVFFNYLKGEDLLKLQIDFVKEQLDYIESHNDILDREYVLDGFAKMYLDLLRKNNVSNQEINVIYKKYWKCDSIRMDCVFTCINNKEYDKALDYIDKYEIVKKHRVIIYVLGIIGFLTMVVPTIFISYHKNESCSWFDEYYDAPCVLYSASVFLFFKSKINNNQIVTKIMPFFNFVSPTTLGIYVLHIAIRDFLRYFYTYSYFGMNLVLTLSILTICFIVVKIVQKIPGLRHIFP